MTQQTFAVDTKPRVLITQVEGRQDRSSTYARDRAAILRMVDEGRITPEEGDMLLSGLRD